MPTTNELTKTDRWLRLLAFILIITGIALRLYIYIQNRDLIIDEANVARNIAERGFKELLAPLDYFQYAPPVFLWITKFFSIIFGMGEPALRVYPLLCGIAAIFVLYNILKRIMPLSGALYPLSLFVFCMFFIRYSSELKQYMPDVFIALTLVWCALRIDINKLTAGKFISYWVLIGSLVIWSSMPSVFILAGVGCYYFWQGLRDKEYKHLLHVSIISIVWVLQFAAYYFLLLKEQANSDYLQNFHHYDFLFATPSKQEEWNHNWYVFSALMRQFEGVYPYVHDINTAFLILGIIMLARKATSLMFLLVIPVLSICAAAALDQYSLLPRVSLFIIPILILIIGYGFAQAMYLKSVLLRGVVVVVALFAAGCNIAHLTEKPFKYEELTEGMNYLKDKKIPGAAITVYHSSVPAFIYYTTLHPGKDAWAEIKDADRLAWYNSYDSLGWQMRHVWSSRRPLGFLYTNCTEAEFKKANDDIAKHMQLVDKLNKPYVKAYVYIKPKEE